MALNRGCIPLEVRSLNDCPCHDNCPLGCSGCDNWTCYEKQWTDHGSFPDFGSTLSQEFKNYGMV